QQRRSDLALDTESPITQVRLLAIEDIGANGLPDEVRIAGRLLDAAGERIVPGTADWGRVGQRIPRTEEEEVGHKTAGAKVRGRGVDAHKRREKDPGAGADDCLRRCLPSQTDSR